MSDSPEPIAVACTFQPEPALAQAGHPPRHDANKRGDQSPQEKSEDGSLGREEAGGSVLIGEGHLEGSQRALMIMATPPAAASAAASSQSATNSPRLRSAGDSSGAGSPSMAKLYLLQHRDSASSLDLAASSSLATPVDPMLAPLDTNRPSGPATANPAALAAQLAHERSDQPNALAQWAELESKLKGKRLVVFLDYDGTLTPIVSDPAKAIIDLAQRRRVAELAAKQPVAIVSGRKLSTLRSFLSRGEAVAGLDGLYLAGSHGFDIACPAKMGSAANKVVAEEYLPYLAKFRDDVSARVKNVAGSSVEDNRFSISVHFRNVAAAEQQRVKEAVDDALAPLIAAGHLRLTHGHMVYEVRANLDWHKGAAVNYLMQLMCSSPALADAPLDSIVPVYIGDDTTDEDAFRTLRAYQHSNTHPMAMAVFVRPDDKARPSAAGLSLKTPEEVGQLLERLAHLAAK